MTRSALEFDEIAADDALIEAIRSGAPATELPSDDPAPALLLALREGADPAAEDEPAPAAGGLGAALPHRRVLASAVAACVLAVAGVGTAVAGDPAAAFSFLFRQGVDLGSRLGSPAGEDRALAPAGGGGHVRPGGGANHSPVRQGSAAAPWSDDRGTREPFGYEDDSQTWQDRGGRNLDPLADRERSTVDTDGNLLPENASPTASPEEHERPTPEGQTYGPDRDDLEDDTDEMGPQDEYGPTDTGPSESSPTPRHTSPTESTPAPTQTWPTESAPTPTQTSPTESPTPTESSPTPSAPTTSTPGEPTSSGTDSSPPQPPSSPAPSGTSTP